MSPARKVPFNKRNNDTTTATTTNKRFGAQLFRNGIRYAGMDTKKPKDIDVVMEYLGNDRLSNSPDEEAFNHYVEQVGCSHNEASMQSNTWNLLAKQHRGAENNRYTADYNLQWTEVESSLTHGLTDAKPDISESYPSNQYPEEACEALEGSLNPTRHDAAMPRFCAEWKGPDGTMISAEKQSAYDGALMVEAAGNIHQYMKKGLAGFLDQTQALTLVLNGECVHLCSNHAIKVGSGYEYHQYLLQTCAPGVSLKDFKLAYKSVRNAQDWARYRATRTKDDLHAFTNSKVTNRKGKRTKLALKERQLQRR
ncbi:MAG: hypothetical protein Q9163_005815 [Psora crenata]